MSWLRKSFTKMAKRIQLISITTIIGIVLLGVILTLAACSGQGVQAMVKATWIEPQVTGDTISIPVSEVKNNKIVHFNVPLALDTEIAFMAYDLSGEIYVRANVCPPCRSVGFSLSGDTLVCDTCRTTFEAKTGEGISGACVAYPKASVPYQIGDGKIVMSGDDLFLANQRTNQRGWP
jgi:nitrite reductase/ring-hydroxylating ferredoxin subunit